MTPYGSVTRIAHDLQSQDPRIRDEAARRIWLRYSSRLLELARRNLDTQIRRRDDEDDVVQSMYKSFLSYQRRGGEGPLKSRAELWMLLVEITKCKAINAANKNTAACRDVRRERDDDSQSSMPDWMIKSMEDSEPTPHEAAVLNEEFERRLKSLPAELRQVALWKFEGCTNAEIGEKLGRTERAVEMKVARIRRCWADAVAH